MRTIQARVDDALAVLGPSAGTAVGQEAWPCGCRVTVRLGNDLLCDWEMCARHAPLAPKYEIGGG